MINCQGVVIDSTDNLFRYSQAVFSFANHVCRECNELKKNMCHLLAALSLFRKLHILDAVMQDTSLHLVIFV